MMPNMNSDMLHSPIYHLILKSLIPYDHDVQYLKFWALKYQG